jgi:hypothetical protein
LDLSESPVYVKGTVDALPPADRSAETELSPGVIVADSTLDFSAAQGKGNWRYGFCDPGGKPYTAAAFREFPKFEVTEWREQWAGTAQFLSIMRESQHPGAVDKRALWAIRRWVSNADGRIRLRGQLRRNTKGDGSIVRIFVDGEEIFQRQLGGGQPLKAKLDVQASVRLGSCVDFAVDPGPAADITFDETWLAVAVEKLDTGGSR